MKDLYEKLCTIIGEVLCYSNKVVWASAPIFDKQEDAVILIFKDKNDNRIEVPVPFTQIVKVHDHTLQSLVLGIVKDKGLL